MHEHVKRYSSSCYRILAGDPTRAFLRDLEEMVNWGLDNMLLSKEEHEFLLPKHPKVATFYGLPKVHKGLLSTTLRQEEDNSIHTTS